MKYTETRRKIFYAMVKRGGAKMSDMAKDNGISKMRVRFHIARIRNDFEGIYTFEITPIFAETYGQSDAIYNAIHNS